MAQKKALGRGLDALLNIPELEDVTAEGQIRYIAVDQIICSRYQPRLEFEKKSLDELADSIRAQGILQPIVVRAPVDGVYELVAGERRWRAAQIAKLHEVPALVKDISDQTAMCIALIENIQRQELNPVEEALGLQRLATEFAMTHEQIADTVGCSRSALTNKLRLLGLSNQVKQLLIQGEIDKGHARALITLAPSQQEELAEKVCKQQLSVRKTEQMVRQYHHKNKKTEKTAPREKDVNTKLLETQLAEQLGTRITIDNHIDGHGKMSIYYHSLDQFDGILKQLNFKEKLS